MSNKPIYLQGRGRGRGGNQKQQTPGSGGHTGVGRGHVNQQPPGSAGHNAVGRGHVNQQPTGSAGHNAVGRGHVNQQPPGSAGHNAVGRGHVNQQPTGSGGHTAVGRGHVNQQPSGNGAHTAVGRGHVNQQPQGNGRQNAVGRGHVKQVGQTAEQRFQAASEKYQESIQRHLQEDNDDVYSSEDEEDIGDNVLEKVFSTYSTNTDNDIGDAQDTLLHSFRSSTSACLVCIETIKKNDPIWSCEGCYAIFHIQCIQRWIKDGVYQQMYKTDDDSAKPEDFPWHCPKCRTEYSQKRFPTRYLCFCGKVEEPHFDPWLVPHSCGQTCGRSLKPDCGHTCLLLCHPGSCPPCPKTVKALCYCGNAAPAVRRCSARTWACGGVCAKKLSCGQHNCQQACHPGECQPCPKTSTQPCQCGKTKSVRPCASPEWQCDRLCGKGLSCGNHICEQVCHKGSCGSCPRGGARICPCGKTEYNLPCTEDIPTCGDTCGRLLDCGLHSCVQRCHQGPCGTCRQMTVKRCRCKNQKEREVPCYKEYLCESKCSKMRDCGKHQCKRKCCDGSCPTCEQQCGKVLACKNHKCSSRCHRGRCYPCTESVVITCFCKATKITVPCGKEKSTKPPRCNLKCRIPPDCHHPSRLPHRCHFGPCQPCRQICGKAYPNCSHQCPAVCHAAVKVVRKDNTKRAGPWEGGPKLIEDVVNKPCPPCYFPIQVQCLGKHEIGTFPCHEVRDYKCGRKCGRNLACGNHTCPLDCHNVVGTDHPTKAGRNCQQCELPCQFDRPEGCTHRCPQPCHSGPCPPCTLMFRMRCHCQAIVQHIECYKWLNASEQHKNKLRSCGGSCPKQISCDHACGKICHEGKCISPEQCEKKIHIRCKCRRQKRDALCKDREVEQAKLVCNDVCEKEKQKKQQKEEEEERQKKEEEEKKQRAELEEFERKMKGRKRKPKKQREEIVKDSVFKRYRTYIIVSVSLALLVAFVAYIMKMN